jgi:hypothetical protein
VTYLELCQRMILECAISGTMTTTEDQTGEFLRVTTWINQAWIDIQTERQTWDFMRSSQLNGGGVSFATIAGQAVYPLGTGAGTVGVAATSFDSWIPRTFRDQTTSVGVSDQIPLAWISYDAWRDGYSMGAQQDVETRPVAIAVGPNNEICVGPWPTSSYTLTGDYYRAPAQMTADADTPTNLPAQYHMAIVWRAVRDAYGQYEAAPEVLQRATTNYRRIDRSLGNRRGGRVSAGRALA